MFIIERGFGGGGEGKGDIRKVLNTRREQIKGRVGGGGGALGWVVV